MTATQATYSDDLLERLGEQAWDILTAAGHPSAHDNGDGFDVLGNPAEPDHVAVIMRRDGMLRGCPAPAILRRHLTGYATTLEAAGWSVETATGTSDDGQAYPTHLIARPGA